MESNKQECITPGGTHFSVNPPALAASGTRILEVPTTMEMNLSEDNKLLGGDPDPSKLSKKRKSYTAAEQAVMKYKNNLRKAKFYLEKSKQTELAGETPNEIQQRKNAWALDILSNEERRKKENLTYKMFCCPKSSAIEKDTSQDDILPPPCKRASYDSAASTSASKKYPSQDDILPPPCKRALHDSSAFTSASKKDPSQDDVFLPPCKRASYDSAVTISENSSSFSVYRKRGKYTKKAESTKSGKSDYASSTLTSSKSSSDDKAVESNKYELKSSYGQCGENAARDTAKLQPIKSGKSDYPSSIPTSSKAATDEKARTSNKPAVKSIDKLPFREIAKMNLKVSIVDANAPDLKMNVNNFSLVENRIQEEMFKLICENASASIAFQMKERYKGFRIINCETKESLDFLKCTVAKMGEIWPNAKLEVRHLYQLSAGPTVKMNLPMGKMNAKLIAALLLMNNKDLPVQNWKLVAYGKSFEGRIPVTFRIDDESLAIIKKKGFEVNFGIRSVMVKLSKSNIESEMERGIVGVDEIQNNTVPDISSLYNEGLELDREVEL